MANTQKRRKPRRYWLGKDGKDGKAISSCARTSALRTPHPVSRIAFLAYTEKRLATLAMLDMIDSITFFMAKAQNRALPSLPSGFFVGKENGEEV